MKRVVTIAICLFALSATADECEMKSRGGHFSQLNLSEDQIESIHAIHLDARENRVNYYRSLRSFRDSIRIEVAEENPNTAKLENYQDSIGYYNKLIAKEMTNHLLAMKEVLTEEQFEKMLQLNSNRKRGGHGGRVQENRPSDRAHSRERSQQKGKSLRP